MCVLVVIRFSRPVASQLPVLGLACSLIALVLTATVRWRSRRYGSAVAVELAAPRSRDRRRCRRRLAQMRSFASMPCGGVDYWSRPRRSRLWFRTVGTEAATHATISEGQNFRDRLPPLVAIFDHNRIHRDEDILDTEAQFG